jgi:hypothetical protein
MFRFLIENPIVAVFVLYALYRIFFARGSAEAAAKKEQAQRERAEALKTFRERAAGSSGTSLDKKMEEAIRRFEARASGSSGAGASTPVPPPPVDRVKTVPPVEAPAESGSYAFHSLMNRTAPRRDYDLDPGAFNYRSAVDEPAEQEFHLKGFSGFRTAHGLGVAQPAGEDVYDAAERFDAIQDIIGDRQSIRHAIIISEILGKPRALRRPGV